MKIYSVATPKPFWYLL